MPSEAWVREKGEETWNTRASSYEWHGHSLQAKEGGWKLGTGADRRTMFYAYIIESEAHRNRRYIGFTADLRTRVEDHNLGRNVSTKMGRPWKLVFYAAFQEKADAMSFESYLKTASGKAFARKRLLPGSLEA